MDERSSSQLPILLVDDDQEFLLSLATSLELAGFSRIVSCADSRSVGDFLERESYACALLDLAMPGRGGLEILPAIIDEHPLMPVIVVTATDDVATAVGCMQAGAADYLTKPVDPSRLVASIRRAIEGLGLEGSFLRTQRATTGLSHPNAFRSIVTRSRSVQGIFRYIEAIGGTDLPILIEGETGVGKELFAHAIHDVSGRRGQFVAVNAAGLDDSLFADTLFGHIRGAFTGADRDHPGLVQAGEDGTVFLDEIGDLSMDSQVKLLRLLQEREYYPLGSSVSRITNARFLCATCHDLYEEVRRGAFRQDLFYRLQSHAIRVPPLRERSCDIPLLFHHFLRVAAARTGLPVPSVPREVLHILSRYDFPGNARELEGMVSDGLICNGHGALRSDYFAARIARAHRGAVDADGPRVTPSRASAGSPFPTLRDLRVSEERLISDALHRANGNKTLAASYLGISRQALCNRIRRSRARG